MNIHAYFQIIFHILMLPVSFRVLTALRIEELFKKGTQRQVIIGFYFIATVALTQQFLNYFYHVFDLVFQIFE